jgi:hypothetical protein
MLRDKGDVSPGKIGGHKPRILHYERTWLIERVTSEPHMTLRQLLAELEGRGVAVSQPSHIVSTPCPSKKLLC